MTGEPWRTLSLDGLVEGQGGIQTGPFGSQLHASDYVANGVPVVMPRDLVDGNVATERIAHVSVEKASRLARYRVRPGDVLLARRGEMGRCARVRPQEDGWLCGTGCLRLRPNRLLSERFLVHFLRSPATVAWLEAHAVGQTLPSLSARTLAAVPVDLPGVHEQQSIAAMLDSVDGAIIASKAVLQRVRTTRDGFFRHLLTWGPPMTSDHGPSLEPHRWRRLPIDSLCRMSNGHAYKTSERSRNGLPVIRIQNLNGSNAFHRYAGRTARKRIVKAGDLLFAWAGVKGSSFGPRWWQGPTGLLNQHIFRVEPGEGVVKRWLFEALKLATREIEERAQGFKSSLLHVRKADITSYLVPVPPREAQLWIAAKSEALAAVETTERSTLDGLIRFKQGLAGELLSGRTLRR